MKRLKTNKVKSIMRLMTVLMLVFSTTPVLAQENGTSTFIPTPALPSDLPSSSEETIEVEQSVEEPVSESQAESSAPPEQPVEDTDSILDGPYLAFTANQFNTQEEADAFIQLIEQDELANGQFNIEQSETEDNLIIVTLEYTEDATPEGRPILYYASTDFASEEEATNFMEDNLEANPDIFAGAEVFPLGDIFDVVFAVGTEADTQAISYNADANEIEYAGETESSEESVSSGVSESSEESSEEPESSTNQVSIIESESSQGSETSEESDNFLSSLSQQSIGVIVALIIVVVAGIGLIVIRMRGDRR